MYSFNSRVRYSELDAEGKLSLSSVINYFQDCSTFHSEDIGLGIGYLEEHHQAWIMNSWQIVFLKPIQFGAVIKTATWAYGFKGIYGYRNFMMEDQEGTRLVNANSVWVFIDTETGRPMKVTDEELQGYSIEEKIDMEYAERKIVFEGTGQAINAFPVRKYHIDTNGHVNNGKYIQMAAEYLPNDFKIKQLRAEYRKAAVFGDNIVPVIYKVEGKIIVALCDETEKPYALVEFSEF